MSSPAHTVVTGTLVGTGANIDVKTLPSKPKALWLNNAASGDSGFYQSTMADGSVFKRVAAGGGSLVTGGNGITPLQDAAGAGFRLGADADLNAAGELLHYTAICE